jgi:uncharacterized protein
MTEPGRARLPVKVIARARGNSIVGWANGRLRIRIAAAPEAGRANAALEAFLAESLGLGKRQVRVVSGFTAAQKLIEIEGLAQPELDARLRR